MKVKWNIFVGLFLAALLAVGCAPAPQTSEQISVETELPAATANVVEPETSVDADPEQPIVDEDGSAISLAFYRVANDQLVSDSVDPVDLAVWERFIEVIPVEYRPEVQSFEPIDGNSGTDGSMAATDDPYVWTVRLDVKGSVTQAELERTMIHEFAHLLTLRPSQIPPYEEDVDGDYDAWYEENKASCPLYFQAEGCPIDNAYMTAFIDEFWADFLPEDVEDLDSSQETADARFDEYPDSFVTAYAATEPPEDIAESFAEYVLADTMPDGDTEAELKILFFDYYPELREIREAIRAAHPAE